MKSITTENNHGVVTLWLNRPEVHNAFHEEMILEIIDCLEELSQDTSCNILLIKGKGKSFCAGADLNWMRSALAYTYEQNLAESLNLSKCFQLLYSFPKPTIAVVQGAAIGGANGLLAACDFALAHDDCVFSLSEVKIGLIPACISPYVIKRVGEFNAKSLMLSGKRINGVRAERLGLVNFSGNAQEVESELTLFLNQLKTSGPQALTECKKLINEVVNNWTFEEAYSNTAKMIAETRKSEEGQEGMAAFLEKRKPKWVEKFESSRT
ncbi:enoyl-CoA hydratase-related protein [Flammeovirgaceae bacterium SG7u.111]|nr:enoyl-CoA hydratase-related protein [Flammeovirgaceae bacterium SG7u.132]WPO38341.1 enoyl-CoA hydratase-related protein [Flammeovirgaceae bacterium SG7u.111]